MAKKQTIIGLTGNIATGKSVVRKMLEHLGAYSIDADSLTHRATAKGAPGYQSVVDEFGKYILADDGEIDRGKLGNLVFSDPDALAKLETIIHPLVRQAVDFLLKNATQEVIVIEAIKLLESPIKDKVNSIWVTQASEKTQFSRLTQKRGLSTEDAKQRISAQSPQADKIKAADVIIINDGDYDNAWKQVKAGWETLFPEVSDHETVRIPIAKPDAVAAEISSDDLTISKARPGNAEEIANFINTHTGSDLSRIDVMAAFGEKAYLLLMGNEQLVGVVGLQVENLVAKADEILIAPGIETDSALRIMIAEVEEGGKELQAEAAMIFATPDFAERQDLWQELGYETREPDSLGFNAWQDAAKSAPANTVMLFKQLRVDRVLRPI